MNEFSPGVVESLGALLNVVGPMQGDRAAIGKAIASRFEKIRNTSDERERLKRANNVLIGMSECGLFDLKRGRLTELGSRFLKMSELERDSAFAAHLIRNMNGMGLLDAVKAIRDRHDDVTLGHIRQELRARGFRVTENEGNASKIRKWLEKAGIINEEWIVDDTRFAALMGISYEIEKEFVSLGRGQRALLITLKDLSDAGF